MSKKNLLLAPVVKWVGGKRQLLETFDKLFPSKQTYTTYCEPFLGGGAVLFHLQPRKAVINDLNADLIEMYTVIRDNVEELIEELRKHKNDEEHFYAVRNWDRDKITYMLKSPVERAARLIYLNKTCYNGLFRVNNAGEFNSPFGHYKNPNIVNDVVLRAVSLYLQKNEIVLNNRDYEEILVSLPKRSFVYLDPPYDPTSDTANFTGYVKGGFGSVEQERLKTCCDELHARGIKFMLSNSATDFILKLYAKYTIVPVKARRAVNSIASRRGDVDEVVVINYDRKES